MAAAHLLTTPDDLTSGRFNRQTSRTDGAVGRYADAREQLGGDLPVQIADRLARVDDQLATLGAVRQDVLDDADTTASAVVLRYGVIITDLMAYQESLGQAIQDPALAESARAVGALSKAKIQMAEGQATAFLALGADRVDEEQVTAFLASQTGVQEALLAFTRAATPEQLTKVNSILTGDAVVFAERVAADVVASSGGEPRISAESASNALGAIVNLVRFAEGQLYDQQDDLASDLRDAVVQQVLVESAVVLLVLVVAVAVALLLARALARSLGQLREGALGVAHRDLPDTVARFSDPDNLGENTPAEVASQVEDPIKLRGRDEIGQVAQAFNVVHQAAVRVAAEQASLRTSVSAMFLNLARRSQTLVDRMINALDDIERNEEDPKRLSRLFALDHLATRMRRNDENLLVLAGADSGPVRNEDAPLPDALRASQSEVEHYARIEFGIVDSDVAIKATAVNDVVRLVAELFDNATRYSPPDSAVVAEARRLGDQVIIQVEDRGVGMPQDQVDQLNAWLAAPPAVEFTTFRRMGLAVVGRLATRHRIRVELRSDMRSGTVVYVALPPGILMLPQHRSRAPEIPAPRTPAHEQQSRQPSQPPSPPPLPARHLGQLPARSAEVVSHSARRGAAETSSRAAATSASAAGAAVTAGSSQDPRLDGPTSTAAAGAPEGQDGPVAGRPPEALLTRRPAGQPSQQTGTANSADATAELPIFREMEAVWFRSHGELDLEARPSGQSGHGSSGTSTGSGTYRASASADTSRGDAGRDGSRGSDTGPGGGDDWRTAADEGWHAAAAAAAPPEGGATRSGLPKRVPQAQLVPGGVDAPSGSAGTQRRSPDEVRGLLSAYHRGVQRGREHGGR